MIDAADLHIQLGLMMRRGLCSAVGKLVIAFNSTLFTLASRISFVPLSSVTPIACTLSPALTNHMLHLFVGTDTCRLAFDVRLVGKARSLSVMLT